MRWLFWLKLTSPTSCGTPTTCSPSNRAGRCNTRRNSKQRGIRLPFECISRADRLNAEVIAALADMGCYRLWIGSESGSQRVLDAMKRKADVADVQAKSKMLQQAGIEVGMFIMLGYDGEDVADLEATVDHLKKSNPDVFLTTVAYPIKGTSYFEAVSDRVYASIDWQQRTDRDLGVAGRYSPAFYEHATRWMVNEVNLHKVRMNGGGDFQQQGRMWLNARRGRMGMRLTQHQREGEHDSAGAGRGWEAADRATDGLVGEIHRHIGVQHGNTRSHWHHRSGHGCCT